MSNIELVQSLVHRGYLESRDVIEAFKRTDRRLFVPHEAGKYAYADTPLSIGGGQTISAPHMVAIITELLEPKKNDIVLEVGAGSGYQAAVLSRLVKRVYSVEIDGRLAEFAQSNLKKAGIGNVNVICGDGSKGFKGKMFDKIAASCAVPGIFVSWKEQLKVGGILVAPVGHGAVQELVRLVKTKSGFNQERHGGVIFVPVRKK